MTTAHQPSQVTPEQRSKIAALLSKVPSRTLRVLRAGDEVPQEDRIFAVVVVSGRIKFMGRSSMDIEGPSPQNLVRPMKQGSRFSVTSASACLAYLTQEQFDTANDAATPFAHHIPDLPEIDGGWLALHTQAAAEPDWYPAAA